MLNEKPAQTKVPSKSFRKGITLAGLIHKSEPHAELVDA